MTDQYQPNNINVPRGSRLLAADTALNLDDDLVVGSTVNGVVNLTLPRAAQIPGQEIKFKANDAGTTGNALNIVALPGESIDGAASVAITTDQGTLCLKSDGLIWRVVCGSAGGSSCCPPQLLPPYPGPGPLPVFPAQFAMDSDIPSIVLAFPAGDCGLEEPLTAEALTYPGAPPAVPPAINGVAVGGSGEVLVDFDTSGSGGAFILRVTNACGCCTVMSGFVNPPN